MLLILRGFILELHFIFMLRKQKESLKSSWSWEIHICSPNLQVSGIGHLWYPCTMDICLVAKICIVCLWPFKNPKNVYLTPFEVSWFPHRGEMLLRHHLKEYCAGLTYCPVLRKQGDACFNNLLCHPFTEIYVLLLSRFSKRGRKLFDEITIKSNIHVYHKKKLLKKLCPEFNTCVMVVPSECLKGL